MTTQERATVDLPVAAKSLGITWRQCYDLVLRGRLLGERTPMGRWVIDRTDLARVIAERQVAARAAR